MPSTKGTRSAQSWFGHSACTFGHVISWPKLQRHADPEEDQQLEVRLAGTQHSHELLAALTHQRRDLFVALRAVVILPPPGVRAVRLRIENDAHATTMDSRLPSAKAMSSVTETIASIM